MRAVTPPKPADPMDDPEARADFYIAEAANRTSAAFEAIEQAELAGARMDRYRDDLLALALGIQQRLGS